MKDVIIVGGGPAGSTCAIILARQGVEVAVLDRARFPRDKPCGEFLTLQAVRILASLGCWEPIRSRGAVPVESICINAPNGRTATHCPGVAGWSMVRSEFDVMMHHAVPGHAPLQLDS